MTAQPASIALRSNPSRYSFAGSPRLINAYAEQQGEDAKAPWAVLACPGAVSCCEVTDTPGRGLIFLDDLDRAYSVHSSGVFRVTLSDDDPFTLAATRIGTVPGTDQVRISRNQADPVQVSIDCDAGQYYIEADVVKKVSSTEFTTDPVTTEYAGGYTLYGEENGRINYSALHDVASINALDFFTAEQYADKLVRIKADGSDIAVFSRTSTEWWRPTSDADLPFQLIGGAVSKKGLAAKNGPVSCDNTIMFPGEDNIVYRFNGYSPQRISTHGIERKFENDADRESLTSFAFSFEGHSFAGWTSTDYTVSYDAATGTWHERESYHRDNWRFRNVIRAWGKNIAQDAESGELFYFDKDTYAEDGNPMVWGMDTPIIHAVGGNGGIVDSVHFDVAVGGGALLSTASGYNPKMMLSWSVDGGNTFKGNRELSIGKRGKYQTKVKTRRLGRFEDKGIMFRIRVSDPVMRGIVAITPSIRPLVTQR